MSAASDTRIAPLLSRKARDVLEILQSGPHAIPLATLSDVRDELLGSGLAEIAGPNLRATRSEEHRQKSAGAAGAVTLPSTP